MKLRLCRLWLRLKADRNDSTAAQQDCAFREWLASPFGEYLARCESEAAGEILAGTAGYRAMELLISENGGVRMLAPQLHRFAIAACPQQNISAISEFHFLPLPSAVVEVAILHHILDYCEFPHESLKEAARVVMPSGHLVIFGFNPFSVFGLLRWVMRLGSVNLIWKCRGLSAGRVVDWLRLLGFQSEKIIYGAYNLPVQSRGYLSRTAWLEKIGRRLRIPSGSYYVIIARKQRLRPIISPQDWLAKAMKPVKLRPETSSETAKARPENAQRS